MNGELPGWETTDSEESERGGGGLADDEDQPSASSRKPKGQQVACRSGRGGTRSYVSADDEDDGDPSEG